MNQEEQNQEPQEKHYTPEEREEYVADLKKYIDDKKPAAKHRPVSKVDWGDRMKKKHEALKTKEVGEPKPETVAKIQRVFRVVGITITGLGALGLLLIHAC